MKNLFIFIKIPKTRKSIVKFYMAKITGILACILFLPITVPIGILELLAEWTDKFHTWIGRMFMWKLLAMPDKIMQESRKEVTPEEIRKIMGWDNENT